MLSLQTSAQKQDTLPDVQVISDAVQKTAVSVQPLQLLTKKELLLLNAQSVADALKQFSGILVKDYGGIGGLKTVSVRSLGAAHTAVMYDGILLSNAQSGQVDLGKLATENLAQIRFYNGHPDELLLPAQAFASGALIQLQSDARNDMPSKKWRMHAGVQTGTLGLLQGNVNFQHFFNQKISHRLSVQHTRSHGEYRFPSYEQSQHSDKRLNSDVENYRLEYDFRFSLSDSNQLFLKSGYYNSDRGLPGAVILFNPDNGDRLKDKNFYLQFKWKKSLNRSTQLLTQVLYDYGYTYYLDPEFNNAERKLINIFHQRRYYLSASVQHDFSKLLSAAWSADYSVQTLTRGDNFAVGFAEPTRYTLLNNVAVKAKLPKLIFQVNLLYSHIQDDVKTGSATDDKNIVSPGISVGYHPTHSSPLHLRAFYKNIFRMPSFNDLYYTLVGNTNLKPEYANQFNLGATYTRQSIHFLQRILLTADVYYNEVKDKILAVPRQNLFQWSMMNVGSVEAKGIDATALFTMQVAPQLQCEVRAVYSYQSAINKSDPNSPQYNQQLPYTPRHSGSLQFTAMYQNFSGGMNLLYSGSRYRPGDQIAENFLPYWITADFSLQYEWRKPEKNIYRANLGISNLFNETYEVVRYYPMPGTQFKIGFQISI